MKTEEKTVDIELLTELVKNPDMIARVLNPISRILGTPKDKLTDSQLLEFYTNNVLQDIIRYGHPRTRGFGSGSTKTLENYLLSKGLIDIPGYFIYLPILKSEPVNGQNHSEGMAELVKDGSRTLVYPIGIFRPSGPTLHFGKSLDDVTALTFSLGNVHMKDIKKFRRLHSQISDSYNRDDYIFKR